MRRLALLALVLVPLLALPAHARKAKKTPVSLEEASALLVGRALTTDRAWEDLVHLCDRIGNRLSGTAALDRAIAWAKGRLDEGGVDRAWLEDVQVPKWVRGEESLHLLEPLARELNILGLGGTVGSAEPIEAEVLVVGSWEELEQRKDEVPGRIVLFDVPFTSYKQTVQFRSSGASRASKLGAVAALVRSVTPVSLSTPHTGALRYEDGVPKIPAAAVTVEDAQTMHRLADRRVPVRVRLKLSGELQGEVPSHNVLADVTGREAPEEVVLLACHIDSWDVGQGAQDDGAGCVMVLEAVRLIAALPFRPRRTVRAVLFTNEENGLAGGRAYAAEHAAEVGNHVAALEADTGAGEPLGWRLDLRGGDEEETATLRADAIGRLAGLTELLEPLGATGLRRSYAGADIGPLVGLGVPGLGMDFDTTGYWPIHHTEADTIDKIDPVVLRRNVAVMAVTALHLAEMKGRLVEPLTGGAP